MTTEIVFYTNPRSRGRIVRWMLEELAVPYCTEILEYGPPMKSAEYLAVNPMGKVPAIRHGPAVVTEAPAICAYLADAFPEAGLAPPAGQRGAYYRRLFFAAGPLEAAVTNRNFGLTMDTLEKALGGGGGYVAGETFTAADVYVGSHIRWGLQFDLIEKRPAFEAYWSRLEGREAYRRATGLDDAAGGSGEN